MIRLRNILNRRIVFLFRLSLIVFSSLFLNQGYAKNINIRDYGAREGNINNDFALKSAIDALGSNDTLIIPAGRYVVDQVLITGKTGITVTGGGTLVASELGGSYLIVIRDCPGIQIKNISIDGKGKRNLGIDVYDCPRGIFQNLKLSNIHGYKGNWGAGILLRRNNTGFRIQNIIVNNIVSDDKASVGIWILSLANEKASRDIQIKDSRISGISSSDDADGIKIQQQGIDSQILIENCYFLNNQKRAIKVQANNVVISGNKVKRTSVYGDGFSVFSAYGNNIKINNNNSETSGNSSVNMFVDISAVHGVSIFNNTHRNSNQSKSVVKDFVVTKYHSIDRSYETSDLLIEGNKVSNVRNFLRVTSSLSKVYINMNTIELLSSNLIHLVKDKNINKVEISRRRNSIKYLRFKYDEIYQPENSKVRIYLN